MPGSTPIYELPYLEPDDSPDIARATEDLAGAVETELARIDARPQPVQADSTTAVSAFTNTAPAVGSPVVGVTFVAPPTGGVVLTVTGSITQSLNGNSTLLGYEVRTGETIGSGSIVLAGSFNRSVQTSEAVNTGAAARITASNRFLLTGLTAGSTYNARTLHWVSTAGTGNAFYRALLVEPVL